MFFLWCVTLCVMVFDGVSVSLTDVAVHPGTLADEERGRCHRQGKGHNLSLRSALQSEGLPEHFLSPLPTSSLQRM